MSITIRHERGEASCANEPGRKLSELIERAGIPLDLQCGGLGVCKKCLVELGPGSYVVSGKPTEVKSGGKLLAPSCRTEVAGETACVFVPSTSILKSKGKIYDDFDMPEFKFSPLTAKVCVEVPEPTLEEPLSDFARLERELRRRLDFDKLFCSFSVMSKLPSVLKGTRKVTVSIGQYRGRRRVLDIEAGDASGRNFSVAVDIGTTTVVAALVDSSDGRILAKASSYNQQMSKADDVASRISYASTAERLAEMKSLVVEGTINPLIKSLCAETGAKPEEILRLAASGNTVMTHLFLGLSPESIGKLPFQPVTNVYANCLGKDLGLLMNPNGVVEMAPSISGYVGGDLTSDIHVAGLRFAKGLSVLIDLGTNSETILAHDGELFACAAAAGPAFEGAGLNCGCRATSGAIERISYGRELDIRLGVIGSAKPVGICGSAIIDFIACGFLCGLINQFGRFDRAMLESSGRAMEIGQKGAKVLACALVGERESGTGRPIFVSELDLEQILKAKAAVYAGVKTLLTSKGRSVAELDRLILAGGFAKYIDIDNAIAIGMLPEMPRERMQVVGNGSLAGAYLALVDSSAIGIYEETIKAPKTVSLNLLPDFEGNFVDALMLPNFNESEFPAVIGRMSS